jgi:hypothetical protein
MKQSSKRLISIFGSLLLVVVALVVFFDVVQPEYGVIAQVKGQIAAENNLLQTESSTVGAAQKIIAAYKGQTGGQGTIDLAMPTTQDIAGGAAQIYGLAQNSGLAIQSLAISPPTVSQPSSPVAGGASAATTKPVGTFSFQIAANGSYESLKNFLSGLETNIRIFDLKGLTVTPEQVTQGASGGRNPVGNQDFFTYNLTVATYYQTN